MNLRLVRTTSDEDGAFGILYDEDDEQIAVTCEREPTGDHPCIPVGTYDFIRFQSPHNE